MEFFFIKLSIKQKTCTGFQGRSNQSRGTPTPSGKRISALRSGEAGGHQRQPQQHTVVYIAIVTLPVGSAISTAAFAAHNLHIHLKFPGSSTEKKKWPGYYTAFRVTRELQQIKFEEEAGGCTRLLMMSSRTIAFSHDSTTLLCSARPTTCASSGSCAVGPSCITLCTGTDSHCF